MASIIFHLEFATRDSFSPGQTLSEKLSSKDLLWPLAIVGLAILIYGGSLTNGFVWDDKDYLYQNPVVTSWAGLKDIWFSPKTPFYLANTILYPVTLSAFWMEHKLWGNAPWGYHTVNLLLHILNALLLFGFFRKWAPRLAGLAALLFAIHPIQVETVAWIVEQKTLLSFFFFMLSCHALLKFETTRRKKDYTIMLLLFTAAFLSKATALCFATVPLLYAWWRHGSITKRDILLTMPLFILAGISATATVHFEATAAGAQGSLSFSFLERILLAGRIFFFYLRQILLPFKFMTFYPKWILTPTAVSAWFFPLGVLGLYALLGWKHRPLGRGAFALLCFYGISLFPVLGFLDVCWMRFSYVADHFSYFSAPTILLLLCSTGSFLSEKVSTELEKRGWEPSLFFKRSIFAAAIVYLAALSFHLTGNYKNSFVLWRQLLLQDPESPFACNNLGEVLLESKNPAALEKAIALFETAIAIKTDYSEAYQNLGRAYLKKNDYEEAVRAFENAATDAPVFTQALCYYRIGNVYLRKNQPAEAIRFLEKAGRLQSHPDYQKRKYTSFEFRTGNFNPAYEAQVYQDLGEAYLLGKDAPKAVQAFRRAVALNPGNANGYSGLGAALMNSGDIPNAVKAFAQASGLAPENESAKTNLAAAQSALNTPPRDAPSVAAPR